MTCFLHEVSLGNTVELLAADYNAASLPDPKKKTHSVWGKGAMAPHEKHHKTLYVENAF